MNVFKPSVSTLSWQRGILFSLAAIGCFHLAYSSAQFEPLRLLSFVYLVFLVQLARLRTTRRSFYFGLGTGMAGVAPQLSCFWNIFGPAAVPLWLLLAFWIGLFVALVHVILTRLGTKRALLLLPFLWTGFEYFRSELYYLKFSWMNIGYTFGNGSPLPLHITGMYGVGFLAAIIAGLVLTTRWIGWGTAVAALLGTSLVVNSITLADPKKNFVRVAGIQMEFPFEGDIPKALDGLLAQHPDADILVLSEYTLDGPVPESLKRWCQSNSRYLIVGGKDSAPHGNFYNTGFVVNPHGEIIFKQVKSVPIQFFKDGQPAPEQAIWNSPWGKIGLCICYDLSYTRVTDQLVKLGAQLLIVPTMDVADWGKRQHELHALVAPVRAAEYGLPIFRLASSGISQAVNCQGHVMAQAGFPGENEMVFAELPLGKTGSLPFDRFLAPASVGVTGLIIAVLIGTTLSQWRKSKAVRPSSDQEQKSVAPSVP